MTKKTVHLNVSGLTFYSPVLSTVPSYPSEANTTASSRVSGHYSL